MIDIDGTPYCYANTQSNQFQELCARVKSMRTTGKLSPEVLHRIRQFFRIKDIYHSNAIEGNLLEVGETRQVVELGLTITGKPMKDQAEARNLSQALDFLETLAGTSDEPIREYDIRQLHSFVLSGISDEAGAYRTVSVEISGSGYKPPGPESVAAQMNEFSSWLGEVSIPTTDTFASVTGLLVAIATHTWFVTIHPFIDGNGRVARLLMNLVLMRYGFPIAIISKEDRLRYYDALEESQASDLTPLSVLVAECIQESLEEYEAASREQREQTEWAQSLVQKMTQPERTRAMNEYEVWRNAMELFKSYMRQASDILNETFSETADSGRIYFKDFGNLEFEKYYSLRQGESTKRTWFFRIDFRVSDKSARYLFFFGFSSQVLRPNCNVTLHISRETPPNSYYYERLDAISALNVPNLAEIGYEMSKERFVTRDRNNRVDRPLIDKLGKQIFDAIVNKHFAN